MRRLLPEGPPLGPAFGLLWLGETVYALGAALTQFALGVWIFQKTGSARQFAGLFVAATLPATILLPWAGSLADRWDRRWVIVAADATATAMVVGLALLLMQGRLAVGHLVAFSAVSGV